MNKGKSKMGKLYNHTLKRRSHNNDNNKTIKNIIKI